MLLCIFLDQRFIGFYLGTDRSIRSAFTASAKQRDRTTKQYHDQNNHYCDPAACNNRCYQCFVPAMIALTAAMVALTVVLAATADAFADALAACAAFCAVFAEAFAAACAVLVAC